MALEVLEVIDGTGYGYLIGPRQLYRYDGPNGPVIYYLGASGITALGLGPDGSPYLIDQRGLSEWPVTPVDGGMAVSHGPSGPVLFMPQWSLTGAGAWSIGPTGAFVSSGVSGGFSEQIIAPEAFEMNGRSYLSVGFLGGGIAVLEHLADGSLALRDRMNDNGMTYLWRVWNQKHVVVEGQDLLLAASIEEHGVTSFRLGENGELTEADRVGQYDGLHMSLPNYIETVVDGGTTYAIVGASQSRTITVLEVAADGNLTIAEVIEATNLVNIGWIKAMALQTVGDWIFVAAGGDQYGFSLLTMLPGGRLVHLEDFVGTSQVYLDGISGLEFNLVGERLDIIATGYRASAGLIRLGFDVSTLGMRVLGTDADEVLTGTAGEDILCGGAGDDTLDGGGGRDVLSDGPGSDTMRGGEGADIFILAADGEEDWVLDFDLGTDRFDISDWHAFSMMVLDIVPTANGATITFRDETLHIVTASGEPLTEDQLQYRDLAVLYRTPIRSWDHDVQGTDDADQLSGGLGNDTLNGLAGPDFLDGRGGEDLLIGGAGDDVILGAEGADRIFGDAGFDTIDAGPGDDVIYGGEEADDISGGDGADEILGEGGANHLRGGAGEDLISGGPDEDRIWAGTDDDSSHGGDATDWIWGGAGDDTLWGGLGNDTILGEHGADLIFGDAGFDVIDGGPGDDILNGGGQADVIRGGSGRDRLIGEDGRDRLEGGDHGDWMNGGAGDDVLLGEAGNDVLLGGEGADRMLGGTGNDRLEGGAGDDTLFGDAGFDVIDGGAGDDLLTGGFNADVFVFADGYGSDRIEDFEAANPYEVIDLTGVSGIASWADVLALTTVDGDDLLIDFGGGDTLRLAGVALADFGAEDLLI